MKHNSYFEGKVQSLGIDEREGYATLGVIKAGRYSFSTSSEERISIVSGAMKVKLPGGDWAYSTGWLQTTIFHA
ncbi:MAG: pyrimidine/purine nucleoside phosphorylase [Spirochaetes bacterium]|nr:pyrimidine/purine nucleoside phosphorylase [Spirochaetota bacterium]